ncbi:MAG TPA: YceI family protein [Cyclobacteriaceae bacterium]|nr:YceI family protein [Cyclobacteriaceae bacterium]
MKFLKTSGLFLATTLILASCGNNQETVETTDAQEVGEAVGTTLQINTAESTVNWRGYKPTGQHYGIIPITSGEIMVDADQVTGGRFVFDITKLEVHDLEAGSDSHGKLTGHLQSEDFFDASNHPEAIFEITAVEAFAAGDSLENKEEFATENTPKSASEQAVSNPTHWVSGNLTMRGTTKNIKFPAAISVSNGSATAQAGFNIDRTQWGLMYGDEAGAVNKAQDQFIYNTVSVGFDVKAN